MLSSYLLTLALAFANPTPFEAGSTSSAQTTIASHVMPMTDRYAVQSVNTVFKDNILLTLRYMDGEIKSKADIDWNKVESDYHYSFTLQPGQEFAFHDKVAKQYDNGQIVQETNAHFDFDDGFKSDGYLTGDGVCHLASIIDWVAKDANLQVTAPTNHNFANIPDVPKEYGVAIYEGPDGGEMTNLYITNNKNVPVTFKFDYTNNNLTVSVSE
ncbi:MAG TPA: VanW family protein [Patescibacteria group bacterium]|nr:VanW family protein [Patescibacteria group bacterium]